MRVCKHFKFKAYNKHINTNISMADDKPWNSIITLQINGEKYESYMPGLFWIYLKHLQYNPNCISEIGESIDEIEKLLKEIEKEFIDLVNYP